MIKFKKHALAAAILSAAVCIPTVALADCNGTTLVCAGPIEMLYASPTDNMVYIDPAGSTAALQCADPANKYIVMELDTDVKRATWQLLLAAFLAGKSVDIRASSPASPTLCKVAYATVSP